VTTTGGDLIASSPDEAERAEHARLETLSRLAPSLGEYVAQVAACGRHSAAEAAIDALAAVSSVKEAEFWIAAEGASEDELVRVAYAINRRGSSCDAARAIRLEMLRTMQGAAEA